MSCECRFEGGSRKKRPRGRIAKGLNDIVDVQKLKGVGLARDRSRIMRGCSVGDQWSIFHDIRVRVQMFILSHQELCGIGALVYVVEHRAFAAHYKKNQGPFFSLAIALQVRRGYR